MSTPAETRHLHPTLLSRTRLILVGGSPRFPTSNPTNCAHEPYNALLALGFSESSQYSKFDVSGMFRRANNSPDLLCGLHTDVVELHQLTIGNPAEITKTSGTSAK
jgi:hypothetical protein